MLFAAVPLRAVPASATDDEAEDAREVLEQLVGVPEQLIRRLLALLAQSEAQRPASDAAVTSDSASASDEQHEQHEDIVGAVEMALQQFDRALPQLRDCCALIVRSVAPLVPHSAAATYSAVFGAAVRAIAAADARAAVMRDLLARFAPTVARLTHEPDSSTLPLPEPALVHMLRLLSAAALHLHSFLGTG